MTCRHVLAAVEPKSNIMFVKASRGAEFASAAAAMGTAATTV